MTSAELNKIYLTTNLIGFIGLRQVLHNDKH